jgi:hypothetical protein
MLRRDIWVSDRNSLGYVSESGKQVPIAHNVGVAIAGAGSSGVFAALAAGQYDISVVLTVDFMRKHAPGFENAYLMFTSPFYGTRGGPCIEGEYTLTVEDFLEGRKFDHVMYRNTHEALHGGDKSGFDVPYRVSLPKKVDGLLVTGRGTAYIRGSFGTGYDDIFLCILRQRPMAAVGALSGYYLAFRSMYSGIDLQQADRGEFTLTT